MLRIGLGLVLAIAALAGGCGAQGTAPGDGGGGGPTATPMPTSTPTPATVALPLRRLGQGQMSGVDEELRAVIRDPAVWRAFWSRHDANAQPPEVDFAREMIAVVVLQRNTGGFAVRLERASVTGGRLLIEYAESRPGPDDVTIQILTQPWALAALPRRSEPADFRATP